MRKAIFSLLTLSAIALGTGACNPALVHVPTGGSVVECRDVDGTTFLTGPENAENLVRLNPSLDCHQV